MDDEQLMEIGVRLGIDPLDLMEGIRNPDVRRQMHEAITVMLGERVWDEHSWMTNSAGWW